MFAQWTHANTDSIYTMMTRSQPMRSDLASVQPYNRLSHPDSICLPNSELQLEKLAFLDIQVTRSLEGLTTSVYRKSTHTDRYIPFHSHHHQRTITGVLRCMRDRAHRICDPTWKEPELQHLQHIFQANGFPKELVRKTLAHQPPSVTSSGTSDEPPKILCVPYIRGLSEKLERVCTPLSSL